MKKFLLTGALLVGTCPVLSARIWKDVDGRALEAEYVSQDADAVTLKLANGKEVIVPFDRLSLDDITHLLELETAEAVKNPPAKKDDEVKEEAEEMKEDGQGGDPAVKAADDAEWNRPIPKEVSLKEPFEVLEEKKDKMIHYSSPHFTIVADARWKSGPLQEILEACELTYNFCEAAPLGLKTRYAPPGGKFQIHTTQDAEDWEKAGNTKGGSVVFDRNSGQIEFCLENYGLGSGGRGSDERTRTVVGAMIRSVTYAMMPQVYDQRLGDWLKLGLPGLVDSAIYKESRFSYVEVIEETKGLLTKGRGSQRAIFEKKVEMPAISDLVREIMVGMGDQAELRAFAGHSMILMTYLLYGEEGGKATNLRAGLRYAFDFQKNMPKTIRAATQEEADKKQAELKQKARDLGEKATALMFGSRPWAEVEADVIQFWAGHDLEVVFKEAKKK